MPEEAEGHKIYTYRYIVCVWWSVCSRPKHFLPLWPSIIKNKKVFHARV